MRSTNGIFVNDARANEAVLQADDRIRLGQIELIVKQPGIGPQGRQVSAVSYDVGSQQGNISNIAGSQSNYYQESSLRYIASRRGRARLLIVWGILLFLAGQGLGLFEDPQIRQHDLQFHQFQQFQSAPVPGAVHSAGRAGCIHEPAWYRPLHLRPHRTERREERGPAPGS